MPLPAFKTRNSLASARTSLVLTDIASVAYAPAEDPAWTCILLQNDATIVGRLSNDVADASYPLKGGLLYPLGFKKINTSASAGIIVLAKGE